MRVAICDDEKHFREELVSLLLEYRQKARVSVDIDEYADGAGLCASNKKYDVVFLDYQMKQLDGMQTARQLRKRNCLCTIVFITNYPQFVFEAFEVNTFRFFVKPLQKEKLFAMIDAYRKTIRQFNPFLIKVNDELKTFNSKDVMYLEAAGKYCIIRMTNQTLQCSKTLSEVLTLMPVHYFYRIHRSYAVNLCHIQTIRKNEVLFSNKERAKISREHEAAFKKVYSDFIMESNK